MCLYPKLIKNPKYKVNKKNGGKIPAVSDNRVLYVAVGCGKCIECCKQKSREWQVRLNEEILNNKNGKFVTLTFNELSLIELSREIDDLTPDKILENEIATLAVRRFLERWRKTHKKSLRHWLITELGHNNTERIHLHGLLFTNEINEIERHWKYGYVYIGEYVNERTINYIVKYVTKIDNKNKGYKPKILTSAGIGNNYFNRIDSKNNKFNNNNTKEYYKTKKGLKLSLPIYYRNKLYTEDEREKLWINKLDKMERWILGEKIDISISEETYFKTLEHYRAKNKRLGYGDDSEEWDVKHYKAMRKYLKSRK